MQPRTDYRMASLLLEVRQVSFLTVLFDHPAVGSVVSFTSNGWESELG